MDFLLKVKNGQKVKNGFGGLIVNFKRLVIVTILCMRHIVYVVFRV